MVLRVSSQLLHQLLEEISLFQDGAVFSGDGKAFSESKSPWAALRGGHQMPTHFWKPVLLGEIGTSFASPPLPVFNMTLKVSA